MMIAGPRWGRWQELASMVIKPSSSLHPLLVLPSYLDLHQEGDGEANAVIATEER